MTKQTKVQGRRQSILAEMDSIKRMRRGALTEQKKKKISKEGRVIDGASCYHLQIWKDGKNETKYVPVAEAEQMKEDVTGYKRFQELALEFAEITEQMTISGESGKKKPRKSRSASRQK